MNGYSKKFFDILEEVIEKLRRQQWDVQLVQ